MHVHTCVYVCVCVLTCVYACMKVCIVHRGMWMHVEAGDHQQLSILSTFLCQTVSH